MKQTNKNKKSIGLHRHPRHDMVDIETYIEETISEYPEVEVPVQLKTYIHEIIHHHNHATTTSNQILYGHPILYTIFTVIILTQNTFVFMFIPSPLAIISDWLWFTSLGIINTIFLSLIAYRFSQYFYDFFETFENFRFFQNR